jgi:hypothetical protein
MVVVSWRPVKFGAMSRSLRRLTGVTGSSRKRPVARSRRHVIVLLSSAQRPHRLTVARRISPLLASLLSRSVFSPTSTHFAALLPISPTHAVWLTPDV